jgi:hypothetical protein
MRCDTIQEGEVCRLPAGKGEVCGCGPSSLLAAPRGDGLFAVLSIFQQAERSFGGSDSAVKTHVGCFNSD